MDDAPPAVPQVHSAQAGQATGFWQDLPRLGVVALGGLYVVGVLIVNMDLARYGVVNLDLARPEYLLAGGLWVFLTLTMSVTIQVSLDSVRRNYAAGGWRAWLFVPLDLLGLIGVPLILLQIVRLEGLYYDPPSWKAVLIPYATLYLNGLGPLRLVERLKRVLRTQSGALQGFATFLKRTDFLDPLSLLLVGLTVYSTQVFPFLPKYFGGGSRPIVQMILSETPKLDWTVVGGLKGEDGKTVGPVALLSETSTMFVIRHVDPIGGRSFFPDAKKYPAIGIDKRLVSVVLYVVGTK